MVVASWTDTIASAGVVVAIAFAGFQARALRRQFRSQESERQRAITLERATHYLRLLELILSFDRVFIERPELRPYFYEHQPPPDDLVEHDLVMSVAEYLLDIADVVSNQRRHGQLDDEDYKWWVLAFQGYYSSSPALRSLWSRYKEFYPAETHALLAIPHPENAPNFSLRAAASEPAGDD